MDTPSLIVTWHELVNTRDPALLDAVLAENAVFRSPAVFRPAEGKALTTAYLTAAINVLGPTLTYVREWYAEDSAVLQFRAEIDGFIVDGIDMITWGPDDRITDFTVMVRPFRALEKLIELMAAQLTAMKVI